MKRLMILMVAAVFLFSGAAFAAEVKDKAGAAVKDKSGGDVKTKAAKPAPPKTMKATGTVLAISGSALQLQCEGKGKKETMDFFLVRVFSDVKAGDKVNVTYKVKDGRNVAEKVAKVKVKAPAKKKPVEPGKPVKDKAGKTVKDKTGGKVESK